MRVLLHMLWCCHMLSIVFVQLRTPASSTSSGTRVIPSMSVYQVPGGGVGWVHTEELPDVGHDSIHGRGWHAAPHDQVSVLSPAALVLRGQQQWRRGRGGRG